jgi:single-stranded-DNA-specific exonuclease
VPAILLAIEDGVARGSGRSVGSVDLYAAICSTSSVLERFGGHAAAVGLTVAVERIDEFRTLLNEHMNALPAEDFLAEISVDADIGLGAIGLDLAAEIALLEPFGHSNPRPLFSAGGVFMAGRERVGQTANHLRFSAYDGADSVQAISFRCPDIERYALCDAAVDLAFEIKADEWRGRRRVQMLVRDIAPHEHEGFSPAAELIEDLFDRADEILAREEYSGIGEADSFHTKLAGVTFEGRQEVLERLEPGTPLRLERQPENPHDANAIALHEPHGDQVGFFNRRLAAALAPGVDAGVEYDVEVTEITGGDEGRSRGVNVLVTRRGSEAMGETAEEEYLAARREQLAGLEPEQLLRELVREFIGDRSLHDAQQTALGELAKGERCLTVMATGRGKSLIFHLHAARTALTSGGASVFVFPLRALVADQAFHLEDAMARIGVAVSVLTGESPPSARDETFASLAAGTLDIVLTTPEFLVHHAGRFAASGRVRFCVVDEAHHVGIARAGHRPAYQQLGAVFEEFGAPAVLAVTATAGDEVASVVRSTLGITTLVTDPTVRENLIIEDRRGLKDKDAYLAALASRGEKTIIYVNSREQSVRLARMLRKKAPGIAMRVAFYNGGLTRSVRNAVERAFRAGEISIVIATSAFGEGVNIPDVRHVVLYHLPFNDIEFNQMCGRSGRDGAAARIHLLFGPRDGTVNELVLASVAPSRDDLAALYRVLKELDATDGGEGFEVTNAELAEKVCSRSRSSKMNERGVSTGLGIFRELGLLESEGLGAYRRLTLVPDRRTGRAFFVCALCRGA